MKNNQRNVESRKKRGNVITDDIIAFTSFDTQELIDMIDDKDSQKRTIVAKLLGVKNEKIAIEPLIT